jgi:DNA-binding protein
MSTTTKKVDPKKAENDIRVGMKSKPRYVIKYATSIMKEKKFKELKFSAVGGSIGKLVQIVEVLKILIPDLYQQNRITSVAYQTVDSNKTLINQRLYPKLEVLLSTEQFKEKTEGTQDKLSEKDRKTFEEHMNKRKEERDKNRGTRRGGFRGRRGGFRGRRGGFRGRRGGFRGNRGAPRRGGFRGNTNRGAPRKDENTRARARGRGNRGTAQTNRGRGANKS